MTVTKDHRPFHGTTLLFFTIIWCSLWFSLPCSGSSSTARDFPLYPVIARNVQFWEKIYGVYSLQQAVIHDTEDLSKIYQVVALADPEMAGSQKLNAIIQKQACEKYRSILSRLATQPPSNQEEQRVAALFSGKNIRQQMARAAENVRSQSGQKERFLAGVVTSGAYMAEIKRILQSYGLPEELAHLPHVESSFNVKAYSRLGAAGLWQFTRETGKQYMTVDYNIDERLDPIISTHAAARYLSNSFRSLNSWPLAITSYNYGLGGMMRAVAEEGSYEKIFTNYNKGYFKFASRNFYSEFLAAANVAKYIEKNNITKLAPERQYRYVKLPGYVHIDDVSRHFGLSAAAIAELNPAFRPPILSGDKLIPKGYALRLPAGGKTNQLISSFPSSSFQSDQKSSRYHLVQKGDTANSIARLHKVSVRNLIQANNLDQAATIRLGQNLRIPGKEDAAAKNGRQRQSTSG